MIEQEITLNEILIAREERVSIQTELRAHLRPITDPAPQRTIVLAVRRDYIHEAMLNAVIRAVKSIIPGQMLENIVRADYIKL